VSVVAERGLLAREPPDGRYTVAPSRWGGPDRALAGVCAGTAPTDLPGVDWVELGSKPDFTAAVTSIDVLATELCYRVADREVTAFLPLWFGLPLASVRAHPNVGALVGIESLAEVRTYRRWFRSLKGELADAVTAGTIPWPVVPLVLVASIDSLAPRERYLSVVGSAERL
jgi:hypothetical protein